jgi:outer membrane lipoprotein carrier protein
MNPYFIVLLVSLFLLVADARAQTPTPSPSPASSESPEKKITTKKTASRTSHLPELLRQVEERYSKGATLRAQFDQKELVASMSRVKQTRGTIEVKRPDKLRWETVGQDANLLVSDGKKFWFYTPPFDEGERGQIIEKKASQVNSRLAQQLISGSFSAAREMKIETIDASRFKLIPKKGSAGTVKAAEITIDPMQKEIRQVRLEHRGGNQSDITLSKIEIGADLSDDRFSFKAPPNTDRVDP